MGYAGMRSFGPMLAVMAMAAAVPIAPDLQDVGESTRRNDRVSAALTAGARAALTPNPRKVVGAGSKSRNPGTRAKRAWKQRRRGGKGGAR